jgi:hypothetical protein
LKRTRGEQLQPIPSKPAVGDPPRGLDNRTGTPAATPSQAGNSSTKTDPFPFPGTPLIPSVFCYTKDRPWGTRGNRSRTHSRNTWELVGTGNLKPPRRM